MFSCSNLTITPVRLDLEDRSSSMAIEELLTGKDAAWVLTSSVIIFTMQTGFGLLESGCVSPKNEVNIMVKNALDVVFGGITYWAFGFGLSFGTEIGTNPFVGIGCFFVDANEENMGYVYAVFIFQLSFATTSTTIVSGAMAERTRLHAYIVFSMLNTIIYCIPAHWIWAHGGFLYSLGCLDAAGCGPVHLIGGATGLVATILLGPRMHVKGHTVQPPNPSPLKTVLGMFMLWWSWLRFNSGSIFVVSTDAQWKLAVRAAVNTIVSSMSGGIVVVILSLLINLKVHRIRYDISRIVNGILGSLVAITGICTLCRPWEALLIGAIAAILATATEAATAALKIDDPVGVIPVHLTNGIWGLLCVGLFVEEKHNHRKDSGGLFRTGSWYLLGVQALAVVCMFAWTVVTSYILLKVIDMTIGLRLTPEEEVLGCDVIEHGVLDDAYSRSVGDSYHGHIERHDQETNVDRDAQEGEGTGEEDRDHAKPKLSFFKDMLTCCHQQDLQIQIRKGNDDGIIMQISLLSDQPNNVTVSHDQNGDQSEADAQNEANGVSVVGAPSMDSGINTRL